MIMIMLDHDPNDDDCSSSSQKHCDKNPTSIRLSIMICNAYTHRYPALSSSWFHRRCVLLGKMFVYFRNPNEQNPVGQLNMRDSRVEEVAFSKMIQYFHQKKKLRSPTKKS